MFHSAFIALKLIMCMKRVFSAEYRVLAQLTSFLLNNAFENKEMLVLALYSLTLRILFHLHVSECFHCVKIDNVRKTRF